MTEIEGYTTGQMLAAVLIEDMRKLGVDRTHLAHILMTAGTMLLLDCEEHWAHDHAKGLVALCAIDYEKHRKQNVSDTIDRFVRGEITAASLRPQVASAMAQLKGSSTIPSFAQIKGET
jgi:hypothetical protein